MQRVTEKMLRAVVLRLNELTDSPTQPYLEGKAQLGCYCLSAAYGGWSLHRICSEGGAVKDVLRCGHIPKRELYDRITSYIYGIEDES